MSINLYFVGALVRTGAVFRNSASVAVDPDVVKFKVRTPAGVVTTYTYGPDNQLVRTATGTYYVEVSAAEQGTYRYRYESTGSGQAAEEAEFKVQSSGLD